MKCVKLLQHRQLIAYKNGIYNIIVNNDPLFLLLVSTVVQCTPVDCRELAFQIADQFKVLGKSAGVRVTVITGGMGELSHFTDTL